MVASEVLSVASEALPVTSESLPDRPSKTGHLSSNVDEIWELVSGKKCEERLRLPFDLVDHTTSNNHFGRNKTFSFNP